MLSSRKFRPFGMQCSCQHTLRNIHAGAVLYNVRASYALTLYALTLRSCYAVALATQVPANLPRLAPALTLTHSLVLRSYAVAPATHSLDALTHATSWRFASVAPALALRQWLNRVSA
jgi:hypothetical protein